MEIKDFKGLKKLLIADQMKKRVNGNIREHLLDEWAGMVSPFQHAEKLDHYESMRRFVSKKTSHSVKVSQERKQDESFSKSHLKETHEKRGDKTQASFREKEIEKNWSFENRRQFRCFCAIAQIICVIIVPSTKGKMQSL